MISFIKGIVSYIGDSYILLDCHDIGFQISMPSTALYGFLSNEDLQMFKQLLTVSGIGPKGALSILSSISTEELRMAIAAEDAKLISSSKGVGLKTAQKLVLELKGKIKGMPVTDSASNQQSQVSDGKNLESAVLFVEATGISRTECMKAITRAEIPSNADIDTIIDLIYKNLSV